jgi:hypothetical protein
MARLSLFWFLVFTLAAADRWVGLRSGPFEVLSDAGDRAARERLADLEQFRGAVEQVLGKSDIRPVWPIRILVLRSAKQAPTGLGLARDAYVAAVPSQGPLPPVVLRECARVLIESGPRGLSPAMERGLAEVFSTLEIDGSRVTLGAPFAPEERNLDWARMHMLTVLPDYYGKLRVAVHNLEQGVEAEPALRNAFGRTPAQIDKEAEAYLRDGQFATTPLRGITLRPAKDFSAMPVPVGAERVAMADLSLANPAQAAAAQKAYQAILTGGASGSAQALEGLGLLALRDKSVDEARTLLGQAVSTSTTSARAALEYARLETDRDKSLAAFEKAAQLNPRWALPPFELAQTQTGPGRRISLLAAAAKLEPRNVAYWRALAGAQEDAGQFVDAAKTWASAELAAATPEERARLRQIHDEAIIRRKQQEAEAKKREADEQQHELEALKQKSVASIQSALEKAQRDHPALTPTSGKVEDWWDSPRPDGKIQGVLTQVDCLGKSARLVVERKDAKPVRLLVPDPGKIVILGGGEKTFGCGPQKPPRNIVVEYFTKPDAKLGTAGEAAVIEFPR